MDGTNAVPAGLDDAVAEPESASTEQATSPPSNKSAFPLPAARPTQEAPDGVRYDFNLGCRVSLPEGRWNLTLRDLDTGNILFQTDHHSVSVASSKHYYVRFQIELLSDGEPFFSHDFDATGRNVLISFPVGTIGDTIGWLPYAIKFKERHGCNLTCAMSEKLIPLFRDVYPDVRFVTHEEVDAEEYYASYGVGLFFTDEGNIWQPCDFRHVGLHRTAGYILGVDPAEERPRIACAEGGRPIDEPYVCIAVQSSTQCKYWNNPTGWRETIALLKELGYRVICIDKQATHGYGMVWNHIPHGCEDMTGDLPLQERARWLAHADFFIGLSSGLSWLAWSVGIPVVLISGFTHPTNEFSTPYRVINYHTCNSCWNDPKHLFNHADFMWCPRLAGTERQFECSRLITADQVKQVILRLKEDLDRDKIES